MKTVLKPLALGASIAFASASAHAFVSVESDTINKPQEGGSGQVSAALEGRAGNTDREDITVGGRLTYQARDTTMFIVGDHTRSEVHDLEIEDNSWAHARYRDEFQHGFAVEAFVDYLEDDFRALDSRTQLGAGARITLDYEENYRASYFGIGALHEWEDQADRDEETWRVNAYFAYKRQLNEQTRVLFNLFYQPSLDHSDDFLGASELAVVVKLAEPLDLKLGVKYEYDRGAPRGIDRDDTQYMTSLNFRF